MIFFFNEMNSNIKFHERNNPPQFVKFKISHPVFINIISFGGFVKKVTSNIKTLVSRISYLLCSSTERLISAFNPSSTNFASDSINKSVIAEIPPSSKISSQY